VSANGDGAPMDLFERLIGINQNRTEDTPDEAKLLAAVHEAGMSRGTIDELVHLLPNTPRSTVVHTIFSLASRKKVTILSRTQWKLAD
jgi:hypothetical protein